MGGSGARGLAVDGQESIIFPNIVQSILVACGREVMLRLAGGAAEFLLMRSNYLASLASTSMCGYIAGSGDRHSANILLNLQTGALVPIDFGYALV